VGEQGVVLGGFDFVQDWRLLADRPTTPVVGLLPTGRNDDPGDSPFVVVRSCHIRGQMLVQSLVIGEIVRRTRDVPPDEHVVTRPHGA